MGESAVAPLVSGLTQKDPFYVRAWERLFQGKRTPAGARKLKSADTLYLVGESLRRIGRPATKALIRVLQDDTAGYLPRQEAARCLGIIGAPEAVEPLAAALENDRLPAAGHALGYLGEEGLAKVLALLESEDVDLRRLAVGGLLSAESPEAVEALLEILEHEDDERLLLAVTHVVRKRGEKRAADRLLEMLASDKRLRYIAIRSLGQLREPRAVEPLTALAHDRPLDPGENPLSLRGEREEAIWALSQIGNEQAVEALKGLLADEDEYIVGAAAHALCFLGHEEGLEPLVEIAGSTIGAGDERSEGELLAALEFLGTDAARAEVDSLLPRSSLVKSDEVRQILAAGGIESFKTDWRVYLFKPWAETHLSLFALALEGYGTPEIARGYLDCYPWDRLRQFVCDWAERHGYDDLAEEAR